MMIIFEILLAILLIFAGRKLFWILIASIGFVYGAYFAKILLQDSSQWIVFAVALAAGVLGVLIVFFVQRLSIILIGFMGGGYIAVSLIQELGLDSIGMASWAYFLVGGVIGVIILAIVFEWALIVISSLLGAAIILVTINFNSLLERMIFSILFIFGVVFQLRHYKKKEKKQVK